MADTLADYGLLGTAPAVGSVHATFTSGAYVDGIVRDGWNVPGCSGLFSGSLSAQGNMVAMQLNTGGYNMVETGRLVTYSVIVNDTQTYTTVPEVVSKPYLTGYIRQYWKNPTTTTFGANTAIPALTGVVPDSITSMPGNLNYYLDLQMTRVTGSDYFNIFAFIGTLNQSVGWLTNANNYLAALKTAESTNLAYYNAKSYKDLISQGFDKYKQGQALTEALSRQGLLVENLNSGYFGTPNAIAQSIVRHGLGAINNFSNKLYAAGVNFDDIYNELYTPVITVQLAAITNLTDLDTIQQVLETTVKTLKSPLDYCSIEQCSGLSNDSAFKNLAEFGADIFTKSQSLTFTTGKELATFITNIQDDPSASVEALATPTTLVPQSVIDGLRANLPITANNKPASLLNIIGTASGYLTDLMKEVNDGMAQLYATSYGPRIRQALTDISRYHANVPLDDAEARAAETYVRVPPEITDTTINEDGKVTTTVIQAGGPTYWQIRETAALQSYYELINQLASDTNGNISAIVKKINDNYLQLCTLLSYEYQNYNRANSLQSSFADNSQLLSFVQSCPYYGVDAQNIGTDTLLYGMSQPTSSGDLLKAVLGQSKNNEALGTAGVRVVGIL